MDRAELSALGLALAEDLETEADNYHPKSDKNDILRYESAGILGMANHLVSDSGGRYKAMDSTLLSDWGKVLIDEIPELIVRVRQFRDLYSHILC